MTTFQIDPDLLPPRASGRRTIFRAFGVGSLLLLAGTFIGVGTAIFSPAPASSTACSPPPLAPRSAQFGFCPARPSVASKPLRWGSAASTADHICCNQHEFAEYSGYWLRETSFPRELPAGETITFYDTASALPLFKAPVGRTWKEFFDESTHHGWPSFRDEETIWENVKVLPGGETVSVNNTHLGHNLPDSKGNRYCINIVCVAGHPRCPKGGKRKSV